MPADCAVINGDTPEKHAFC